MVTRGMDAQLYAESYGGLLAQLLPDETDHALSFGRFVQLEPPPYFPAREDNIDIRIRE